MSSARRAGQAAGASAGARRLAKGKAVADGESSGKRKSVGGVPAQTKRPQQLGFGGLLDFDVTSVPGTLAYWLLEHFDHQRCCLMLPNDVELEILLWKSERYVLEIRFQNHPLILVPNPQHEAPAFAVSLHSIQPRDSRTEEIIVDRLIIVER
ncbi:hypothetical protein SASPL_148709 [Salvia splendens]|uniref:Uncharacterized protein n=1 Tax=Salvia splendens TaxID=180675 RepID=A0A8X8WAP4_SALSN|nr:hypothetical protein SASPL_148709 [Salvia splendens]